MNIDHLGKLYETFGQAAQMAQFVEKELVLLLLIPTAAKSGKKITTEDIATAEQELEKLTMGKLKNRLKPIAIFGDGSEEKLEQANKKRNFLIHHFFSYHNKTIHSPEGRRQMIAELEEIRDLLHFVYRGLSEANLDSFTTAWGIPKDLISKHLDELEAKFQKRNG